MSKISVIVPHYPVNQELEAKLDRCVSSLKDYDELILVVNQGEVFAKAVNRGLRLAKGDFLVVVSNDTYLVEGDLNDLCTEGVTSPVVNNLKQEFWGCFFSLSRAAYEKIGGLDEQFEVGYFEDDDLIMRFRQAGIEMKFVNSVKVKTEGGQTMQYLDKNLAYQENKEKFIKKWGVPSSNPIKYD